MDRTKPHRNGDVPRRTVGRPARQPGDVVDRELVRQHALAMTGSLAATALLVLPIAAAGLFAGVGNDILVWALVTAACHAGVVFVSRRAGRHDPRHLDAPGTRRMLLAAHFVGGLGWAYFASLGCGECQLEQFSLVKGIVLLLALAATALATFSLRGALAATFVLPVAVYIVLGADIWKPADMLMAALLAGALPLFTHVAGLIDRSSLMLVSFRTERDALVAELDAARAMSEEARHRAEEANLAKSRFLATMSHELRTPLNAILGFSEVMGKEVFGPIENPTYREYASDIQASGQHLLALINEILDLSRIEAGRYQLIEEPVSVAAVVEDCCHLMELRAGSKDIRLVQHFEAALPCLLADERAMRQITLNLLSNAVKFTPAGGEILVRAGWTAGGGQYVSVKDNGAGIPAEEIPIVLSAFGQGSSAVKSSEQGTGLGLPIVQGLVAMHGGRFELRSKPREGTEAIAIFPPGRVMDESPALPGQSRPHRQRV